MQLPPAEVSRQLQGLEHEDPTLHWFRFEHLPEGPIQDTSADYARLALVTVLDQHRNAERTIALRKLIEAKDASVRSMILTMSK